MKEFMRSNPTFKGIVFGVTLVLSLLGGKDLILKYDGSDPDAATISKVAADVADIKKTSATKNDIESLKDEQRALRSDFRLKAAIDSVRFTALEKAIGR